MTIRLSLLGLLFIAGGVAIYAAIAAAENHVASEEEAFGKPNPQPPA
ncbi:MAG: hypothetical protein HY719_09150, partial [Planctomycetes bacterium]|nr:hypothetical protein [Planctomycetota bacterium]